MIAGIGVDLFETRRFTKFRTNPEFLSQIFSAPEIARIKKRPRPGYPPAVLFALKEAALKALGKGLAQGWLWRHVDIGPGLDIRLTKTIKRFRPRKNFKLIHAAAYCGRRFALALTVIEK